MTIVFVALASVGLTVALRAVPPFSSWNERGVKPWACDLCMSFWGTLIFSALSWYAGLAQQNEAAFGWMPAFALAYGTVQRIVPPPMGGPPVDPPWSEP